METGEQAVHTERTWISYSLQEVKTKTAGLARMAAEKKPF